MKYILLSFAIALCFRMEAQVTFTQDIAPIVFDHCTKCHRPGEIGPMPFTNYTEVAANGLMIQYVTDIGYMPPWRPDHTFSTLRDENWLTQQEIDNIATWVESGMPEGNPADMPSIPEYIDGSQVGIPDLVLTMEEPYLHQGTNTDQYQIFVLPTGLTEDKDIRAIEVRADNNQICHHAILGMDTTSTPMTMDAADPEYGYTQFGGFGFDPTDQFFGAWVPGSNPMIYPPTIGKKLFANSSILMQMHYGPSSINQSDQTSINIFYSDEPIQRYVITYPINPYDLDVPFIIPPDQVKTFHGTIDVPIGVSLIGIGPHAHLLGKSYEVYAVSANLLDTIPLIKIPQWNFNWQGFYAFPSMLHIPAGYKIHCIGTFDNTTGNPFNPSDPPQWTTWGEGTSDEMYLCYLQFVPYLTGDENINLSSADEQNKMVYQTTQLFPSYPNPARDQITLGFSLADAQKVRLELFDAKGILIRCFLENKNYPPGLHKYTLNVDNIPAGLYFYKLTAGDFNQGQRLIIQK